MQNLSELWPPCWTLLIGAQETAKLICRGSSEVKSGGLEREVCRKWPASDYCTHGCHGHHHLPRYAPSACVCVVTFPQCFPSVCLCIKAFLDTFTVSTSFAFLVVECVCWIRSIRLIISGGNTFRLWHSQKWGFSESSHVYQPVLSGNAAVIFVC